MFLFANDCMRTSGGDDNGGNDVCVGLDGVNDDWCAQGGREEENDDDDDIFRVMESSDEVCG